MLPEKERNNARKTFARIWWKGLAAAPQPAGPRPKGTESSGTLHPALCKPAQPSPAWVQVRHPVRLSNAWRTTGKICQIVSKRAV